MEQLSLFSNTEYKTPRTAKPVMDAYALEQWKSRVFTYQKQVRETCQSNKRWKNTHDCKEYIGSYQELNHRYEMKTAVNIGFWWDAPVDRKPRQTLEQMMIQKWRSPFNKEMWDLWGQPFGSY